MLGGQGEISYLCGWNKKLFIGQENGNRESLDSFNISSVLGPAHSLFHKHLLLYAHISREVKR